MNTTNNSTITVETTINAPINKVWEYWIQPNHITAWNSPSEDWHTPSAENDVTSGGKFNFRMEAKDGSMGFDFEGVYDEVIEKECIKYTMSDGRKVSINFMAEGDAIKVSESFEPESINSLEMQKDGWQAILDNFKKYTESN